MNLSLIDPFILAQDYPDTFTGQIRSGHSTALRFNRKGDLLASGRVDGTLIIFDVETNGVALRLRGHTRQIQSLSWSRSGRYLLSSGQDCKSILWDLQDGSKLKVVRFEAPVYIAELHPSNHLLFVAALYEDVPTLVDVSSEVPQRYQLPTVPNRSAEELERLSEKQIAQDAKQATSVVIFNSNGQLVITGTSKGWINIIDVQSRSIRYSSRICNSLVLLLRLSSSGRDLLCNASDRVIRTLLIQDGHLNEDTSDEISLDVEHKFQDLVQRLSWNHATFSANGDYVAATTYMNHDIYIWERGRGSLVKILECSQEELGIVEWHPVKPIVVASGLESGRIYFWSILTPQRWSALAPDFAEVEENIDYIEREDEFDIHPIEEIKQRKLDLEDELVDVLTLGAGDFEEEEGLFVMPVLQDLGEGHSSEEEMVEVGPGVVNQPSNGQRPDDAGAVDNSVEGRKGVETNKKNRRR